MVEKIVEPEYDDEDEYYDNEGTSPDEESASEYYDSESDEEAQPVVQSQMKTMKTVKY